jgi:hypothetical protein
LVCDIGVEENSSTKCFMLILEVQRKLNNDTLKMSCQFIGYKGTCISIPLGNYTISLQFLKFKIWEMLTGAPGALVKDIKNEII